MLPVALQGRAVITQKVVSRWHVAPSIRQGWYTNGVLHSNDDDPALVSPADYYIEHVKHVVGETPHSFKASEVSQWFSQGQLHRDGDRPAVVFHTLNIVTGRNAAMWYTRGLAHTPERVLTEALAQPRTSPMPLGIDAGVAIWKGAIARIDSFDCKWVCDQPRDQLRDWFCYPACSRVCGRPQRIAHTHACKERDQHMCWPLAEFGVRDTVKYDRCGLIHCEDAPVVRGGVKKEWWTHGRLANRCVERIAGDE
jgi:hypothetical protein